MLEFGIDTLIDQSYIPFVTVPIKSMLLKSAIHCIDQIVTMTKQRIVSGPFDIPLLPNFRASYNNAIDPSTIPNITMTSPQAIADLLYECASKAYLYKLDHKSAFKLVSVRADIVKFQGFHFLGKFFIKTNWSLEAAPHQPNMTSFMRFSSLLPVSTVRWMINT